MTSTGQDSSVQESATREERVACWHSADVSDDWTWQWSAPDWLPADVRSIAQLAACTDEVHAQRLRSLLNVRSGQSFHLQLPITVASGDVRWIEIEGQADADAHLQGLVRDITSRRRIDTALRKEVNRFRGASVDAQTVNFEAILPSWKMRYVGVGIQSIAGYSRHTWLTQNDFLRQIAVRNDRWQFGPARLLRSSDKPFNVQFTVHAADGRPRTLNAIFRVHQDEERGLAVARGMLLVAPRAEYSPEPRTERERHIATLYDETPVIFFSVSDSGEILSINRYGAKTLGYRPDEIIGMSAAQLHLPSHRRQVEAHFKRCLEDAGKRQSWETCLTRQDGGDVWVRATARALDDASGGEILLVCEDITQTRQLSEQLRYQENFDLLTGLGNRQRFEHALEDAVELSDAGDDRHVLCYIDLDQFKVINDTCGHDTGDKLLLRVSRLLARHVRERDALARLGGDEFGILFRQCAIEDGVRRAENIGLALSSDRFTWAEQTFRITASIGLVDMSTNKGTQAQLLSLADTACFAAKDQGRDSVVVYHSDNLEVSRRHREMNWVARLQSAVDNDLFELFYQPIRSISRDASRGRAIEVLLRLPDADGFIQPSEFLRAAENYQLAVRIDSWVCDSVLTFLAEHAQVHDKLDLCCVNLSSQSITDDAFLAYLVRKVTDAPDLAKVLCFEITETGVIANMPKATQFIRTLQSLGCRFALDDFGSGVSSFAYLKRLPVDIVKIDGMFVRSVATDVTDRALVASINDISHSMGKRTIAEYVESEAALVTLREMGVDYAQGFYLAQPMPISELFAAPDTD